MAGFTSLDDLVNEITTGGKIYWRHFAKTSSAPEAAGVWVSLWKAAGMPGAGADPATTPGTAYDDTAGSIFFPDQGSDQKHLVVLEATATQNCSLMLYDRLVGVSGISVATTGNKTVNSAALPRYSAGASVGVEVWAEVTTVTATTAPQTNLSQYTDDAGNNGQDGAINNVWPAAATNVDTFIGPHALAAGDVGVRSVEVGFAVDTAASAGVCNVDLIYPLAVIPLVANVATVRSFVPELPRIYDGASLAFAILATSTTAVSVVGRLGVAYG